ncbi:hypothetical protein [Limoniibacter endophyticus]|uniref:Uncharacterized protein n=1 Tax=Limoniibacter endophyticus TaxID=1565040 RepID=A0A8J3DL55_9HYPH|nr:hypothetical protein [Limoniibacter endophyticus]GHC66704.1 hypothetical protein GCM10010136_10010 [Limoniibacter endophyticus]
MRVLYVHPTEGRGERRCLAFVDIELNEDIRLNGLRLIQQPDGRHFIYACQAGKHRTATFSPALARKLTDIAVEAYGAANAAG